MSDADQQTALAALREQGDRCAELLRRIEASNRAILERSDRGDLIGQLVSSSGYNRTCQLRANEPPGSAPDPTLLALRDDPDLKAVCDNRWLLGEAIDDLRSRLERLDTIAAPYEDLEKCIRRSVTGIDRTPAELAQGIDAALALARRAASWTPRDRNDSTLLDRWKRKAANHPLTAALIILVSVLSALAALWNALPDSWIESSREPPPRGTEALRRP